MGEAEARRGAGGGIVTTHGAERELLLAAHLRPRADGETRCAGANAQADAWPRALYLGECPVSRSLRRGVLECRSELGAERYGFDGGVAVHLWFDLLVNVLEAVGVHTSTVEHALDVREVLPEAALNLR